MNRIFVNGQHHLTALSAVSGSFTSEASVLPARRGGSEIDEETVRVSRAKVDRILSARERMRPFADAAPKLEDETRLATTLRVTRRHCEIHFQVPNQTIGSRDTGWPARLASRPNWAPHTTFAVGFGAVLTLGVALRLEYFDNSLRNFADVESRQKIPGLGGIPFQRNPLGSADDGPANTEPWGGHQPNLKRACKPGQPHGRMRVSAGPGKGKSTTLRRLAAPRGVGGERGVRIDSDLRRPTQHRLANRPQGSGLGDFPFGQHNRDEVTQKPVSPGRDFTPGGTHARFTLGLLHANRLRDLIATLRGRCHRIVFGLAPIIGVSATSVLASAVDGAVLRIRHRRNPWSRVRRAPESVGSLKMPLLGVVLNRVPLRSGEDDGYYPGKYACASDGSGEKNRRSHASSAPRPPADWPVLTERGPEAKGWGSRPRISR